MKTILFITAMLITLANCAQTKSTKEEAISQSTIDEQLDDPAYILFKNNCLACHGGGATHDALIAPPMIAVKKHYINSETTKEDFVNAVTAWVPNPNEALSRMPGAIRRFKLMPPLALTKEDLTLIAAFIYDNDMTKPVWFDAHEKEMHKKGKGKGKGKGMHRAGQ